MNFRINYKESLVRPFASLMVATLFLIMTSSAQTYLGGFQIGGTEEESVIDTENDADGNLYIMGGYRSLSMDLDPGSGVSLLTSGDTAKEYYIAKYDSAFNLLWSYKLPYQPKSFDYNGSGKLALTGYFEGNVDFDLGSGTTGLTANSGREIFFAVYDLGMSLHWVKQFDGNGDQDLVGNIAWGPSDELGVTFFIRNSDTFDVDPDTSSFAGYQNSSCIGCGSFGASYRSFFSVYDSAGNHQWYPGACGSSGNVTSGFAGRIAFASTGSVYYVHAGCNPTNVGAAWTITKYSISGVQQNQTIIYDANFGEEEVLKLDFDDQNNLYALIHRGGTQILVPNPSNTSENLINWTGGQGGPHFPGWDIDGANSLTNDRKRSALMKFDANTNHQWSFLIGEYIVSSSFLSLTCFASDMMVVGNSVVVGGHFTFKMDFDPSGDTFALQNPDTGSIQIGGVVTNTDAYVASFGFDGGLQNAWAIGGDTNEGLVHLAKGPNSSAYVVGEFDFTADLNPDSIANDSFASAGDWDVFVSRVRLDSTILPLMIDSVDTSICAGESILLGGQFRNTAGVFSDTSIQNQVTVSTLSIFPTGQSFDSLSICQGDSILVGNTYYISSGTYIDSLQTGVGCDSLHTVYLTVLLDTPDTISIDACDDFTFNGIVYTASGVYPNTFQSAGGCDSLVVLDLIVGNSSIGIDSVVACGFYTWIDGVTYFASNNTATFTMPNAAGCDSIISLILTILPSSFGGATVHLCQGDSLEVNGTYVTQSGIYYDTLASTSGCDSIVTLFAVFHRPAIAQQNVEICEGESFFAGGQLQTMAGTYQDVLSTNSQSGCDSILQTNLSVITINPVVYVLDSGFTSADPNALHQWLDCEGPIVPIAGANGQTYYPSSSGTYAVALSKSSCVDTSSCFQFVLDTIAPPDTSVGLGSISGFDDVRIFPNPSNGRISINLGDLTNAHVWIYGPNGSLILSESLRDASLIQSIDLGVATGLYAIVIQANGQMKHYRVVKNQ